MLSTLAIPRGLQLATNKFLGRSKAADNLSLRIGEQIMASTSADSAAASQRPMTTVPRVGVGVVCLRPPRVAGGEVEVLMIQRGTEPSKGLWTFPGGKLELGESIVGCAIRELREETGITLRCATQPPTPETTHLGSPLTIAQNLETPVAFTAVDCVVRHPEDNTCAFHYAIIEVAGVPEDPDAPIKAADDAADAAWVAVSSVRNMDVPENCDVVAE